MSSRPPKMQSTSPMGADGIVRCHHGEQADKFVSRTSKNPDREFYCCSRPKSERCGFWFWIDDPIFSKPPPQTTPEVAAHPSTVSPDAPRSVPANGLCTPRASPFQSTSTSAPQHTPAKRKHSEWSDSPAAQMGTTPTSGLANADTPGKKARIQAIEAGLQARLKDETPQQQPRLQPVAPEHLDILPFTHGGPNEVASAPSPISDTTTEVEQDAEPPRVRYSFLGLPPTQESEVPSTPKKRPSTVSDGRQNRSEASSSALLTPPQSAKQHGNRAEAFTSTASGSSSSRPEPDTPTRHKGKGRATQWDQHMETEDNPFVDTTSSFRSRLETDALQRTSPSRRSSFDSQGPSCTPTTGEQIASNITKIQETIYTLLTYADNIGQLDAPKFVERLERQRNAIAYGEEAKKQQIALLSAELEELREQLRQSEASSRAKDKIIASLKTHR